MARPRASAPVAFVRRLACLTHHERRSCSGRRWLDESLSHPAAATLEPAKALHTAGLLANIQQAHSEARQLVEESLALSSSLNGEVGELWARLSRARHGWNITRLPRPAASGIVNPVARARQAGSECPRADPGGWPRRRPHGADRHRRVRRACAQDPTNGSGSASRGPLFSFPGDRAPSFSAFPAGREDFRSLLRLCCHQQAVTKEQ